MQEKRAADIDDFDGDGSPEIAINQTTSDDRTNSTLVVSTCHLVTDPNQTGPISENQQRLTIGEEGVDADNEAELDRRIEKARQSG